MALGLIAAAALQAASADVAYALNIERTGESSTVTVTLAFPGEADGDTVLVLPDSWGGQTELWKVIEGLRVEGGELAPVDPEAPERRLIRHEPGADLLVDYFVVQDVPGTPEAGPSRYYRPFLQPDYVHLIGYTIFAYPEDLDGANVSVSLSAPQDWTLASDLQHAGLDMESVLNSIIVAGDFRLHEVQHGGAPIRLALRGDVGLDDEILTADVERVVAANLEYWGSESTPYLVTLLPLAAEPGRISIGGTNLDDAFALFLTPEPDTDIVVRLLAHEHTHTWNPHALGEPLPNDEEALGYWFTEGFTDYLATRAGVRGGSFTAEQGVAQWNEFLRDYASSPVNMAPNEVILDGFWSDPDIQRLPYLRGQVFAALADARIHAETNGAQDIDDVIHAMLDSADDGPAPSRFVEVAREVTGVDLTALFQHHIMEGEMIWLPGDAFGACGPVETQDEPVFVYGFTLGENENGERIITEVEPGSNAEAAGFEPGMFMIQRVGGAYGDASVQSVMRIRTVEGEARDIAYWPTNGDTLRYQQIAYAGDEAACRAALAGLN